MGRKTLERLQQLTKDLEDGWVFWGGGVCPVDPDDLVEVRLKNDWFLCARPASRFRWNHIGERRFDIAAYRVVQTTVGEGPVAP